MAYYRGVGALLYDLVELGLDGDSEFYLSEAKRTNGKVLELGCGTGRIYLKMLENGIDAYGIDASEEMLDLLKKKAGETGLSPRVKKSKMQSFRYPFKFDLVIIPYRGFNHMLEREGQARCLRNIRRHLKAGGRLILDFFDPETRAIELGKKIEREKILGMDGKIISAVWTWRYRMRGQIAHLHCEIRSKNSPIRKMDVKIRYIFKEEFEGLLKSAGFRKWKLYGGFKNEPYAKNGRELVWVIKK